MNVSIPCFRYPGVISECDGPYYCKAAPCGLICRCTIISMIRHSVDAKGKQKRWCPRRDSNPRPQDSSHFGFRRRPVGVRGLDCPFTLGQRPLGAARPVSTPSPKGGAWLGIGKVQRTVAFPDFEQIRCAVSARNAQFCLGILCSIQLSYADPSLLPALYPVRCVETSAMQGSRKVKGG